MYEFVIFDWFNLIYNQFVIILLFIYLSNSFIYLASWVKYVLRSLFQTRLICSASTPLGDLFNATPLTTHDDEFKRKLMDDLDLSAVRTFLSWLTFFTPLPPFFVWGRGMLLLYLFSFKRVVFFFLSFSPLNSL